MFMNNAKENGGIPRSGTIRRRSTPGRTDSAQTRLELGTAPLPAALNSTAALLSGTFTCRRRRRKEEKGEKKI